MMQTVVALALVFAAAGWLAARAFRRATPARPTAGPDCHASERSNSCSCSSCPVARR
jgi:hypothetical protein